MMDLTTFEEKRRKFLPNQIISKLQADMVRLRETVERQHPSKN